MRNLTKHPGGIAPVPQFRVPPRIRLLLLLCASLPLAGVAETDNAALKADACGLS